MTEQELAERKGSIEIRASQRQTEIDSKQQRIVQLNNDLKDLETELANLKRIKNDEEADAIHALCDLIKAERHILDVVERNTEAMNQHLKGAKWVKWLLYRE